MGDEARQRHQPWVRSGLRAANQSSCSGAVQGSGSRAHGDRWLCLRCCSAPLGDALALGKPLDRPGCAKRWAGTARQQMVGSRV